MGRYLAKIGSDVLVKNPLSSSWNFRNSETIGFTLSSPLDITPYVQLDNYIPATKKAKKLGDVNHRLAECLDRAEGDALEGLLLRVETALAPAHSEEWEAHAESILQEY